MVSSAPVAFSFSADNFLSGASHEVRAVVALCLVIGGIVGWYVRGLGDVRASTNFAFIALPQPFAPLFRGYLRE
jgi:hypothetical protein